VNGWINCSGYSNLPPDNGGTWGSNVASYASNVGTYASNVSLDYNGSNVYFTSNVVIGSSNVTVGNQFTVTGAMNVTSNINYNVGYSKCNQAVTLIGIDGSGNLCASGRDQYNYFGRTNLSNSAMAFIKTQIYDPTSFTMNFCKYFGNDDNYWGMAYKSDANGKNWLGLISACNMCMHMRRMYTNGEILRFQNNLLNTPSYFDVLDYGAQWNGKSNVNLASPSNCLIGNTYCSSNLTVNGVTTQNTSFSGYWKTTSNHPGFAGEYVVPKTSWVQQTGTQWNTNVSSNIIDTNGRLTFPVKGLYHIAFGSRFTSNTSTSAWFYPYNGWGQVNSKTGNNRFAVFEGTFTCLGTSFKGIFNTTDIIEPCFWASGSNVLDCGAGGTYLSVSLINAVI
jgi:hypothetical protein